MPASGIIDNVPLWLLCLLTAGLVLLVVEVGWRMGNRARQRTTVDKDAPIGAAVGATLGLLAFLLAFTFGMAASRFDTRKQMVLQEANAIGTTYLRADFLPEPQRSDVRNVLRAYAILHSRGVSEMVTPENMAQSAKLQDQLWADTAAVVAQDDSIKVALFVESLNELIDMDSTRVTAGRNHIPDSIWFALYVVTVLAMVAMGYQFGLNGQRNWAVTLLLTMVFTAVIIIIADLDRPQGGTLRVSQQAILDVIDRIGAPAP